MNNFFCIMSSFTPLLVNYTYILTSYNINICKESCPNLVRLMSHMEAIITIECIIILNQQSIDSHHLCAYSHCHFYRCSQLYSSALRVSRVHSRRRYISCNCIPHNIPKIERSFRSKLFSYLACNGCNIFHRNSRLETNLC